MLYLGLGSNLGSREEHLEWALAALETQQIVVVNRSSLYETAPRGFEEQPWFLNMAVACQTSLSPLDILAATQRVELQLGRNRSADAIPNGPRTIDVDILLYSNMILNLPDLVIPHPRMCERRFVLEPLLEIAPDLKHPQSDVPFAVALKQVQAQQVRRHILSK